MIRTAQVSRDKLIVLMAKIPFFNGLSGSERSQIAGYAEIYVADKGEEVIRKGETDTCFYVLLSGRARVVPDQKAEVLSQLEPGDVFGEIGFILHSPRNSWILADSRCALLRVDQRLMSSLDNITRERLKDQIILKLARVIQTFNDSAIS